MPPLPRHLVKTNLGRLEPHLSGPVREVFKVLDCLDEENGKAALADIQQTLFPLAKPSEAKRMLNGLRDAFNQQAEARNHPLRLVIAKAQLWFEGQTQAPRQPTPDLNAIPEGQRINQRGVLLNPPKVVLLTFNEHEHRAVLAAFGGDKPPFVETRDGIDYNRLGVHGGMEIIHAISEAGSGGLGAAQQRTGQAIRAWQPKAVIAVGIAFGMNADKQDIGDVLVSTQLRPYESARVNADGSQTPRASYPDASPSLLNRIRTANLRYENQTHWPKVEFGQMLTGEKLLDNLEFRERLKTHYAPEAKGGEMEGTGLYVEAQAAKVDWIVVKAICDFADGNKGKNKEKNQILAATNAAQVLKAALGLGNLYGGDDPAGDADSKPHHPPSARFQGLRDLDDLPGHLLEPCPTAVLASLRKDVAEPAPDNAQSVDVLDYLLDWAKNPKAPPLFALLGEYGMGKTITCQRLALALEHDPACPVPLYFDLRHVTGLDKALPDQKAVIEDCIKYGWHKDGAGTAYGFESITRLIDQGAVLILDGLDEVLVKLSESDGQTFTNQLLRLLSDSRARLAQASPTRLLISCRTQYFRTLRDQQSHFTGQERGEYTAAAYLALLLLPFSEEQVRRYLANALPEADPERLLETIRAVHNLEELTRRPYTLKLVAEFIPDIEQARAAGRTVHGVTLYRNMASRWLDRDKGKHHIKPEHKLRLAAHLAAELWRSGRRVFQVGDMEAWFHTWLDSQPDLRPRYAKLHPDQLEEDLRTATFLTRQDAEKPEDSGFRFAHTSMQEFFLAEYLLDAVRENAPERWAMDRPSRETLDFFGQMLAEVDDSALLATLQSWRKVYQAKTSELLLDYALVAWAKGWPVPILHGMDLRGADLRGWKIGYSDVFRRSGLQPATGVDRGLKPAPTAEQSLRLDLGPALFAEADLRETQFHHVNLNGADFSAARLDWAEFHHCNLRQAQFNACPLTAAIFRHCRLTQAQWHNISTAHRAQFLLCENAPALQQTLQAPSLNYELPKTSHLALLLGHQGEVRACVFSPNGTRLLSAGYDGTLRLWDAASGESLRVLLGHQGRVLACAFSADGGWLLSAGDDGTLRLWDAVSGECFRVLTGHRRGVNACVFSPDRARLLSAGDDGTLRLWDAASGESLRVLAGHQSAVWACTFSLDGTRLLSAGYDGTLRLWDAASGKSLRVLAGHQGGVRACVFSPDGSRLLSAGYDGTLRLWNAASGAALRVLAGHQGRVLSCAFSPDGARLLSAGHDQVLRLWNAASGETLRVLFGHQARIRACAFSPEGSRLLSAGSDGTLRLWDAASGKSLRVLASYQGGVRMCAFSPDGARLLSAGDSRTLRLWDAVSGESLQVLAGKQGRERAYVLSPNGSRLLLAGGAGTLRLWDAASGEFLRVPTDHKYDVNACAFSPDGAWLLLAGSDGTLRLWDIADGKPLRALAGHQGRVRACAFSPDGTRLLSAGNDRTLRLWDTASGKSLRVLVGHQGRVGACTFSPDGARLLSAGDDWELRLWDATSGKSLRVLVGHVGQILACAFSPDGTRLLSAGYDGTLRLWDAETGECLRIHAVISGEQAGHAVWSPIDNRVIEANGDAWRWLAWQDDTGGRWPLESFGPVPAARLERIAPGAT